MVPLRAHLCALVLLALADGCSGQKHHKEVDYALPVADCGGRLLPAVLSALEQGRAGTALIIGANAGATATDPIFEHLKTSKLKHIDKVFVEPIPALFQQLQNNIAAMPRATAVQAAIAPSSLSRKTELPMYCLIDPTSGQVGDVRTAGLSEGSVKPWWAQVCSLDYNRLFAEYDMKRDLGTSVTQLASLVRNLTVPALSVSDLLRKHVQSPVRYVQIDVEGFDDHVVNQLPLGARTFKPGVITFEWVLLGQVSLSLSRSLSPRPTDPMAPPGKPRPILNFFTPSRPCAVRAPRCRHALTRRWRSSRRQGTRHAGKGRMWRRSSMRRHRHRSPGEKVQFLS